MADKLKKRVLLFAYQIDSSNAATGRSDLFKNIKLIWEESESISERRFKLSAADNSKEIALISLQPIKNRFLFGTLLKLAPLKGRPALPETVFDGKTMEVPPAPELEKLGVIMDAVEYFILTKSYLVSTIPTTRIRTLEKYLAWWLLDEESKRPYRFTPMVRPVADMSYRDVKAFKFSSDVMRKTDTESTPKKRNYIIPGVDIEYIKNYFGILQDLDSTQIRDLIDVELSLTFRDRDEMEETDFRKQVGGTLQNICNLDEMNIVMKNGKKVKGTDIVLTRSVDIDRIDMARIDEKVLLCKMKDFIKSLEL